MVLMTSAPRSAGWPPSDARALQRDAQREVLFLLAAATGLLVLALLLGRTRLGLAGSPDRLASWTDGAPGLAALRALRFVMLTGSAAFVIWLAILAVMCAPQRTATSTRLALLPFGRLMRQALVGTVALALVGSSGGAAIAASRPAVVANDATGGQRWPELPHQPGIATRAPHGTTPLATDESVIVRTPTILPWLVAPPSTTVPPTPASTAEPIGAMPAGPSLAVVSESRFSGSGSSIVTTIAQHTARSRTARKPTATRIVRAGESFWSIAEDEVLTSVDEATDADVADYWRHLIEVNRARLPDPTNPDLLWVGTALTLPYSTAITSPSTHQPTAGNR